MEVQTEQNIEIVPTGDTLWRAARHFLVLLHFICMKISHGSIIYIIDEDSRSALQSLEQNFFFFHDTHPQPPPLPPPRRHPLLSSCSSHPSFNPTSIRLVSSPIPLPFIPLQPFGLSSFRPSISQTLHLHYPPSGCPPSLMPPSLFHLSPSVSSRGPTFLPLFPLSQGCATVTVDSSPPGFPIDFV